MSEPTVIHSTFVIERSFPHPPKRVFTAFSDPAQFRRWFATSANHSVEEFAMDFRPGGSERILYRFNEGSPFPGAPLLNQGIYLDIVPNQRIVTASTMTLHDNRFSASLVTIELIPSDSGTDLTCTFQGAFFEGADGPEIREMGWRSLFVSLDKELASFTPTLA